MENAVNTKVKILIIFVANARKCFARVQTVSQKYKKAVFRGKAHNLDKTKSAAKLFFKSVECEKHFLSLCIYYFDENALLSVIVMGMELRTKMILIEAMVVVVLVLMAMLVSNVNIEVL